MSVLDYVNTCSFSVTLTVYNGLVQIESSWPCNKGVHGRNCGYWSSPSRIFTSIVAVVLYFSLVFISCIFRSKNISRKEAHPVSVLQSTIYILYSLCHCKFLWHPPLPIWPTQAESLSQSPGACPEWFGRCWASLFGSTRHQAEKQSVCLG